jgi:uncharacterized protein (DUF433 family)
MQSPLGYGVYSFGDASRLLGIPGRKISAWFRGWHGGRGPVFDGDYASLTRGPLISFLDLIDVSVAASLRKNGASLHTIRRLKNELAKLWSTAHPFSRQELYADDTGHRIFLKAVSDAGETTFLEILQRQHAMEEVLVPFLKRVEYDPATQLARRLPLMAGVVIDPRRRYGKPIVEASGMSTSVLYRSYQANACDIDAVADWYGVRNGDVEIAVRFETEFSGIAA